MDAQTELVSETGQIKHAALTLYCYYCMRRNKETGLCFPSLGQTVKDTGIGPKSNVSMLRHFLEEIGWIEVFGSGVVRPLKGFYSKEEIFKRRLKRLLFDRITILLVRTIVLQNRTLFNRIIVLLCRTIVLHNRTPVLQNRTLFKGILNQPNQPAQLTSVSADSRNANPGRAPNDKKFDESSPLPKDSLDDYQPAGKPTLSAPALPQKPAPKEASAGKPADDRINHPAVQMVKEITGRYPPKSLWDRVIREIQDKPNTGFFRASWEIWLSVGGSPQNFEKWLFEPKKTGLPPEIFDKINRKTPDPIPIEKSVEESELTELQIEALEFLRSVEADGDDIFDYQKWYPPKVWAWLVERLKTERDEN